MELLIDEIQKICIQGNIKWTSHILARLQERNINPSDVKTCIMNGEIIEEYPKDYPYPSCLIFGHTLNNRYLHTVIGVGNNFLWLITAYYPDLTKWNEDFKTRKGA